jgi:sulfofructose kinase
VLLPAPVAPRDARKYDVFGLGQNSIDLVARLPAFPGSNSKQRIEQLAWLPGGQVASALVGCARLGWRACYCGAFGDDELGARGRASLEDEGVVVAATVVPGARSRFALVLVDGRTGERTVLWDRDATLGSGIGGDTAATIADSRVLLVDCEDITGAVTAAEVARSAGVTTVIDVETRLDGLERLLPLIDIIVTSQGFPEEMTGLRNPDAALAALERRFRPALACVTLGSSGSVARCDGRIIRTPAYPVPCIDSTGAGDAFRAGFISALLRWGPDDVDRLLRYANAVAGLACRSAGARDGLPTSDEVDALMGHRRPEVRSLDQNKSPARPLEPLT